MILNKIQSHPLFIQIQRFIAQEHLLQDIKHIDVALSGGADSVCLLAILCATQHTGDHQFTLRAHHVRHHLREDDQNDAQTAQDVADIFHVPYIQSDLNWENTGKPKANIEETARDARYDVLFNALNALKMPQLSDMTNAARMPKHSAAQPSYAAQRCIDEPPTPSHAIALAHHGDENLETLLWRLGRGCGLEGLCLAPRRIQHGIALIRPLLGISKAEVYAFLNDCEIPWAEDPTNTTDLYRRNRIRQQILPTLRAEAMSESCLYRSMIQIRRDADAMTSLAKAFVQNQKTWYGAWFCPWSAWQTLDHNAQAQVLRQAVRNVVPGCCPNADFIERALEMLERRSQAHRQTQQKNITLAWSHGGIMIFSPTENTAPPKIQLSIPCQNVDIWNLCQLTLWTNTFQSTIPANTKSMLHIDASVVHGQLNIRPACDFPKLQTAVGNLCQTREALRSQGVPDCWRPYWPILCDDNQPLWVLGGMRTLAAKPPKPEALAITIHIASWHLKYV